MERNKTVKHQIENDGFAIINDVFSAEEVQQIISLIEVASTDKSTFRKAKDLFAIRQFLKEIPAIKPLLFTSRFQELIQQLFGTDYFIAKAIYFDKPPASNWFVSWHQDLTISVDKKLNIKGFGPWTVKQNQFAVQPPVSFLENNFTIRIHLDNTDENNGALRVLNGSHKKGIVRLEIIDHTKETATICEVKSSGIMLMRPLLFHASGKTINDNRRRVIHIECSRSALPAGLQWSEYDKLNTD